ncbi:hypothetical protein KJ742_03230 [Patescibacteria group bacterium]|nr:hypothetical protein [Patescibacteria group bacterium]MBU1682933.1 hypothetical protein [Patescibacteria group bacterium]MBU1935226.1 hypothetical protein [Patescibacteria group bacterium]
MRPDETGDKARSPLKEVLLKNLRAEKLGLSHPLVVEAFSEDELSKMQREAEGKGSIIIDDLGPMGRLEKADIEELRLAIIDAEESGFRVPEGVDRELFCDEIRTLTKLTLDPGSIERHDFTFETNLEQSVAERSARWLEKKLPGLQISFEWADYVQRGMGGRIKKTLPGEDPRPLPAGFLNKHVVVTVAGMPVGVPWDSEGFLKSCLEQEGLGS